MLLPEADQGVEEQHDDDHGEIAEVPGDQRKDRRRFDHPRNRAPEQLEQLAPGAGLLLLQRIGPALLQPLRRFRGGQTLFGAADFPINIRQRHLGGGFRIQHETRRRFFFGAHVRTSLIELFFQ
ncbi:hypothetical protein SDC9_97608 [bioreactor metagenome]|uniref:Uncharacterized protein n=1 Tax=bioreactor metagenome TaxID=1076179 RepID=A0A645ACD4_9ZZZZ